MGAEMLAPTMPASEIRALALTSVRLVRHHPGYGGRPRDAVRLGGDQHAQRCREHPLGLRDDGAREGPDQEGPDGHGAADRPAPAVAEPVEEGSDQWSHDRERKHREPQEERDLPPGLAAGDLEEQRAGERDRHSSVAGSVERMQLDQPTEPRVACALRVRCPAGLPERERAETGRPPGHCPGALRGDPSARAGRVDRPGSLGRRQLRRVWIAPSLLLAGRPRRLWRGHVSILP